MNNYSPTELEEFVRVRAPEIAGHIQAAAQRSQNEADLVAEVEDVLKNFERNFDINLYLARERTLINGRADAVYNRFVIEYEPPRSLRPDPDYRHNKHAVGQVKQYMDELERLDRHKKERMAGVVLDGFHYIFVRYRDDHWRVDDPVPVNSESTATFLRYLLSLSTELAVTPENLVRDFGENSNVARLVVRTLYSALERTNNPLKVGVLFNQWQLQFSEITGWGGDSERIDLSELAPKFGITQENPNPLYFFFAVHSYYATFIKLLAVQIAHYYMIRQGSAGLRKLAASSSDELCDYLAKMERGGIFREFGIRNFLEGDFFGWYLEIWDEELDKAIRRIISELSNYSLVTLDVDPEETRDLLKKLYENLMPKKLRHALGEYYTPDWLAERLLNQLGYDGNPAKRLLDPACGSGTFLVLAIKRVRQYAKDQLLNEGTVLGQVLENIVGFDLNPLAVISARTNYLLALGDLLRHQPGDITIPVYLADSILTPSQGTEIFTHHTFEFNTVVGRFSVPRSLVNARYIDELADLLEECTQVRLSREQFRARLLAHFPLQPDKDHAEIDSALRLYDRLLELDAQKINGIWARIIKNAFAPLFAGKFDYIAGNPPWINWDSLPEKYRQSTVPLWQRHKLFEHSGYKAILGGSKDDLSILLTYIAAESYLKQTGSLAFVITQSVFQTAGSGRGFRRFELGDGSPLQVVHVDDMVELQPFESANNRTAVVVITKNGLPTRYPVPYAFWRRLKSGASISSEDPLSDVIQLTKRLDWTAEPIDRTDRNSAWFVGRSGSIRAVRKLLGKSPYQARKGVFASVNGVFWVEKLGTRPGGLSVVSNLSERSKRSVEGLQAALEDELIYPLLQGREVKKWSAISTNHILVTHRPESKLRAIPENVMAVEYPKTYNYLKNFESLLRTSGLFKRYYKPSDPFYSMFDIGEYTFAPYKVVYREISTKLQACVIGYIDEKPIIPDHKLILVPFSSEVEAHYVCAVLNSSVVGYVAQAYTIATQFSSHLFENISIPKFESKNEIHTYLATLSSQAHMRSSRGDSTSVIENEIDHWVAKLWDLSDEELSDIQKSLVELG